MKFCCFQPVAFFPISCFLFFLSALRHRVICMRERFIAYVLLFAYIFIAIYLLWAIITWKRFRNFFTISYNRCIIFLWALSASYFWCIIITDSRVGRCVHEETFSSRVLFFFWLLFHTFSKAKAIETRIFSSPELVIMKRRLKMYTQCKKHDERRRNENKKNFPSEFSPVPHLLRSFTLSCFCLLLIKRL